MTQATSTTRAAIYARTATTERNHRQAIEAQERAAHDYAAANGITVAAVYTDWAMDWPTFESPGFGALMAAAFDGQIDAVIVTNGDRLAHEWAMHEIIRDMLDDHGVRVIEVRPSERRSWITPSA